MEQQTKRQFHSFYYIISQYFYLFPPVFAVLSSIIWPYKVGSIQIHSATIKTPWNSSNDPHILSHLTDIHMSRFHSENADFFRQQLEASYQYRSKELLITGDLVYSFTSNSLLRESEQLPDEWETYKSILSSYADKFEYILDLPGNHDMFNIWDINSSNFLFLNYSFSYNRENTDTLGGFQVRYFNHNDYGFIAVNPYSFPTFRNPFMIWITPTTQLLNSIERMIEMHPNSIVLSHYPAHTWDDHHSSSGKTFKDMISSTNVRAFLAGHTHPKRSSVFTHYSGGGIEEVSPAGKDKGYFTLITDDNGRLSFHNVKSTTERPQAFVTHPIPFAQQSTTQPFMEKDTEVRVIVYNDTEEHTTNIQVSGCVQGKLEYQRDIDKGVSLYSMPLHLEYGKHQIVFSGALNESFEFVVGETLETLEVTPLMYGKTFNILVILTGCVWFYALVVTFPFFTFCEKIEKWIEGITETDESSVFTFLAVTVGSPLLIRERIGRLPLTPRIILFLLCLAPVGIPTYIITCENHFGFVWSYGYYMAGYNRFEEWASICSLIYLLINVIIPSFAFSALGLKRYSKAVFVDIFFVIVSIAVNGYMLLVYGCEMCGIPQFLLSPGFFIAPLIWICTLISQFAKKTHNSDVTAEYLVQSDQSMTSV